MVILLQKIKWTTWNFGISPSKSLTMINSFSGIHAWLSNFYICDPFIYDGIEYTSSEAAFQAHKSLNLLDRMAIAEMSASQSKKAGKKLQLRADWNDVRLQIMEEILTIKFQQPELKTALKLTGTSELIEGNYWKDYYWGVCEGIGENNLGKILMKIRSLNNS